jgi:hypothetical protein
LENDRVMLTSGLSVSRGKRKPPGHFRRAGSKFSTSHTSDFRSNSCKRIFLQIYRVESIHSRCLASGRSGDVNVFDGLTGSLVLPIHPTTPNGLSHIDPVGSSIVSAQAYECWSRCCVVFRRLDQCYRGPELASRSELRGLGFALLPSAPRPGSIFPSSFRLIRKSITSSGRFAAMPPNTTDVSGSSQIYSGP